MSIDYPFALVVFDDRMDKKKKKWRNNELFCPETRMPNLFTAPGAFPIATERDDEDLPENFCVRPTSRPYESSLFRHFSFKTPPVYIGTDITGRVNNRISSIISDTVSPFSFAC